ncbi:hypothetical protein CAPTEDRAFT_158117 [Capitella teleta]|uniref:Protein kinase domain-containing protein n=1 Tax=Capitella teleta TaxID=283909 RepID=R7TL52_CAPTE|nr:hypothetical protein CAPTEDRAFT_158117 [Capitella teleta]|eukprot:ELT92281.1 hypothetical protein CAPTEDRAFT_158117 [Capitella teleta]
MRKLEHHNIVKLKFFFYSSGDKKDEVYLNLVLEYVPETVYRVARHYSKSKQTIPILYIKLYMYQLFRSLAYIHSCGVCHRDIKPQNLLLDPETGVLKLCDFGSAKQLIRGEPNFKFPQIKAHPWPKVFRSQTPPEAIELVSQLLEYTPSRRISPLDACAHNFFDELREGATRLPNGRDLPPLFNFTAAELAIKPSLNAKLLPPGLQQSNAINSMSTPSDGSPSAASPAGGEGAQGAQASSAAGQA